MDLEESRKRKTPQKNVSEDGEIVEENDEPGNKILKVDDQLQLPDCAKHNLENNISAEISNNCCLTENDDKKNTDIDKLDSKEPPKENKSEQNKPSIIIMFENESVSDLYKSKFIQFINTFFDLKIDSEDTLSISVCRDESIKPEGLVLDEVTEIDTTISTESSVVMKDGKPASPRKKHKKHSKAKRELFVLDSNPSPNPNQNDLRYTSKFTITADKDNNGELAEKSAKQTCFNCDEFHALKDCHLPRDHAKINAARQKFKQQIQRTSRYHLDEQDKRFSHLEPGKISNELRKALGLQQNELPHYIYSMRMLGYPPGWLEEAKFVHSNLNLFDSDGNHVKGVPMKRPGLDPHNIVDYPGFNVPPESHIRDEYKFYGVRPFSKDFSKEAMIKYYEEQFEKQQDNLEACDMDLDDESTSSPEKKTDESKNDTNDLSLIDLEQQKQELLKELNQELKGDSNSSGKEFLAVKTSCLGTPVLKSKSPFEKLPSFDNFSKDVSPVINFENLPNSTGKYEQMVDVLQKVRTTLKTINNTNT